jgi:ribosome maturation factor RimP
MVKKDQIIKLAEQFLADSENYLIDVKVSSTNKIMVLIENDNHVSISDCIALSRHIEHSLDREQEDFELEVSSPGIDQPFKSIRQFKKYIGQEVDIKLRDGLKHQGKLVTANESAISIIASKEKRNKNIKNQPSGENPSMSFQMKDILETRLVIKLS